MLEYLSIKNFAIIDDLAMPFNPGLTVLTGETGAGKSIIVDALMAVLGEKAEISAVRSGENTARVEAAFDVADQGLPEDMDSGGELIIAREIRREGRGRATVNGAMIPIPRLGGLGDRLVDLHGQHEHQSLLRTSVHLEALDSFGSLERDRQQYAEAFARLLQIRQKLANGRSDERERLARLEYLRYVIGELDAARLDKDEEDLLKEEERVLSAAGSLRLAAHTALEEVYQAEGSAAETVQRAAAQLAQLLETDRRLSEACDLLRGASVQLEEAGHFLRGYASQIQDDPQRLERVQERLALLADLKKKYGPSLEDVLRTLAEAREELALLEEGEMDMEGLRTGEAEIAARAKSLAESLSRGRKEKAASLEEAVRSELRDLAMDKVRFTVSFGEADMSETGTDRVEFLLSPNPGEPLMPLRKIASGGELSRVMLALKRILAGAHAVPTLVFDEVDAGIGGRVAAVLGRKLQDISRHHQVLCITHLAPVAACASHHVVVEKTEEKGRTVVKTRYLQEEERVRELARMMGGIDLSPGIVRSAKELLEEARG